MTDHVLPDRIQRGFTALVEIERDEQDKEDGGWVTFDCFSQDQSPLGIWYGDDSGLLALRAPLATVAQLFPDIAEMPGHWAKIEVASYATGDAVEADVVMFGTDDEIVLYIISAKPLMMSAQENALFMLENEQRAPASLIQGVLEFSLQTSNSLAVAAYDVGQGNCNAIVDEYEHPRVFFDLGWAPNFHAKTRPPIQPVFFCDYRPTVAPVVLSHWDMDHWCYAIAKSDFDTNSLTTRHQWRGRALRRHWIARAPVPGAKPLGPLAQSFYHKLARRQAMHGIPTMLLWPNDCERIPFSDGWLEACAPDPELTPDRNNTGIAMFVQRKGEGPAILLTGDADFTSIPSLASNICPPLAGMVAPHHGSDITTTKIPVPMPSGPKTLAFSVGQNNHYGHPKVDALDAYKLAGWIGAATQNRHTCDRTHPSGHNHNHSNILLKFTAAAKDPRCTCGLAPFFNLCLVPSHVAVVNPVPGVKPVRKPKAAKTP
jgi:beta-lactamase superfamily II metal-dependent hydrolase